MTPEDHAAILRKLGWTVEEPRPVYYKLSELPPCTHEEYPISIYARQDWKPDYDQNDLVISKGILGGGMTGRVLGFNWSGVHPIVAVAHEGYRVMWRYLSICEKYSRKTSPAEQGE